MLDGSFSTATYAVPAAVVFSFSWAVLSEIESTLGNPTAYAIACARRRRSGAAALRFAGWS